jgi:hypothetical protein
VNGAYEHPGTGAELRGSRAACRLLVIMGSGETSPTMVSVHRDVAGRLGVAEPSAVLIETPYGFQENAELLSARSQAYFARSVGLRVDVPGGLRRPEPGGPDTGAAVTAVRAADWVFSGPGSPSYALDRWRDGPLADVLRERVLAGSGVTVFASAAACTLGTRALPVYEIYKVGADPHWLPGLRVLDGLGLKVAVIPHYDNTEGGHHDTRYCYLGERRLRLLEADLTEETAVLGIDEHTAVVLDLGAGTVTVRGRGGLTVRRNGRSTVLPAGSVLPLAELRALVSGAVRVLAGRDAGGGAAPVTAGGAFAAGAGAGAGAGPGAPADAATLGQQTAECRQRFDVAAGAGDTGGMVQAILDLEAAVHAWAADPEEDDGPEAARAVLRGLIRRLGGAAVAATCPPARPADSLVAALVKVRDELRRQRAYPVADAVRQALAADGVELRDTAGGTRWHYRGDRRC